MGHLEDMIGSMDDERVLSPKIVRDEHGGRRGQVERRIRTALLVIFGPDERPISLQIRKMSR